MSSSENGRVVVVTGANRGIGYHVAATLVEDGYRVAGLDVEGASVVALRETAPERARFYDCDVSSTAAVERAVAGVIDEWGRVDVLVNNAANATFAPFEEQTLADTRREFEVNYFGYVNTTRAVLPHMRARDEGIVHNVSSGTALAGHPGLTGYAATKGAIEAFTLSLQLELRHENVWCTVMRPPTVDTRLAADLGYPDWLVEDPATVGRRLAGKVESTAPVIVPDWRTRAGLFLIQHFPSLWGAGIERFTDPRR